MQVSTEYTDKTNAVLTISGEHDELAKIKQHVLEEMAKKQGNVPGFRQGKAPLAMVEKQLDPSAVQSEFLEHAVNDLLVKAVNKEKLRAVSQPKVDVTKFVAYDTLEFTAAVEVVGEIKLGDYKSLEVEKQAVEITDKDVEDVLERLKTREAEKTEVDRAAKDKDEVLIDFNGVDAETKEPVAGADGKEYPLVLGSNSFIPGFESEVVGMKAGEEKTFDVTFPEDYGAKELQGKKVTFTVKVSKVQEMAEPKLDDAFAAKIGPFESLEDLKSDIKKQITAEREQNAEREYENALISKIAEKTEIALPDSVVDQEITRMEEEEKQNLVYRGQTWQEHLKAEGVTEEQHREQNREQAKLRVKAGLLLSEIAEKEGLEVSQEELQAQVQMLKGQYQDESMQAELDKPENQRELVSRILTQKTVAKVKEYNQTKA